MVDISLMAIGALTPNRRNARTHSRKQIGQICDSIVTFGYFDLVNAIKVTIPRPRARGSFGETDLHAAQQHVVELDQRPDTREPHPIDEYQLASRLSYFLWSSMPDDELIALAAQGRLRQICISPFLRVCAIMAMSN